GDFDGDGNIDLLEIRNGNDIYISRNDGQGTYSFDTAQSFTNLGASPIGTFETMIVQDANGDGEDDIAFVGGGQNGFVSFLSDFEEAYNIPGSSETVSATSYAYNFSQRANFNEYNVYVPDVNIQGLFELDISDADAAAASKAALNTLISEIERSNTRISRDE